LPGRRLTQTGGQHVAHDNFVDFVTAEANFLRRFADDNTS
jgi:hypothetical protein